LAIIGVSLRAAAWQSSSRANIGRDWLELFTTGVEARSHHIRVEINRDDFVPGG
jgi:hypothetical protein